MTTQSTYDPGPVPPPTEQDRLIAHRIRVIAAIFAAAQWLTDHPEAPTPATVSLYAHPRSVAAIDTFADTHDTASRYTVERHEYSKISLATSGSHGVEITYTVAATRPPDAA